MVVMVRRRKMMMMNEVGCSMEAVIETGRLHETFVRSTACGCGNVKSTRCSSSYNAMWFIGSGRYT
jgi:hypothetical protein